MLTINKQQPVTRVWIQGSCFKGSIIAMLARYGGINFKQAKSIELSDMILYTGGSDISPSLYGEATLHGTSVYEAQDKSDVECYSKSRRLNKLQVGICRGAQLLNVLNGGKLWQDVDNHAGSNHLVEDVFTKKVYEVSSLHHQGIILNPKKGTLLAYCNDSKQKRSANRLWTSNMAAPAVDVEAFWYEESKCYGVQWHPEIGPQECVDWFYHYLEMFKAMVEGETFEKERA